VIETADVMKIHQLLIEEFGGSLGLRDSNGLEAALNRPKATFEGKELYPRPIDKAAALLESILINHPFIDGNKRVGYVLMRLFLLNNNLDIEASEDWKYNFVISITTGKLKGQEIKKELEKCVFEIK
jgi:death-on-curing protein